MFREDQLAQMREVLSRGPDSAAMNEQMARLQDASQQQFENMHAATGDLMAKLHGGR